MRHEPQSSISDTTLPRLPAQRAALHPRRTDRSRCGSSASGCQNGYDLVDAKRRRVQALVGRRTVVALVLCSIRTRYTADPELCNNANPSRRAKTTTCSGIQGFEPQDSGIIMQQSHGGRAIGAGSFTYALIAGYVCRVYAYHSLETDDAAAMSRRLCFPYCVAPAKMGE
jgi:hypothetical protein